MDNLPKPTLILLPNLLSSVEENGLCHLSATVAERVYILQGLIAESEKEGRRYLKRFPFPAGKTFRDVPIVTLNEHTSPKELQELLVPVMRGEIWGLISDAGLPCVADPGTQLVALARKKGIVIEALAGPSSLFLALMLSGLSGQRFSFLGYLEREQEKLKVEIKNLEKESMQKKMTQICIEAPYRSSQLLETLLSVLEDKTLLSLSSDLMGQEPFTETLSIREWKKREKPQLHKKPTVFLFFSG